MIRSSVFVAALVLAACGPIGPVIPDAGPFDAGTGILPVTCVSNVKWTMGNQGNEGMNPGLACRSCHLGQNFMGQNPNLESNQSWAMFFMGTVYSGFNEANLCLAKSVPAGTVVEILDSTGALVLTLPVNAAGNFRSNSVDAGLSLPYRARVRSNGMLRAMGAAQMNGDCNSCHTEQGRESAPGRIVWP